MLALEFLLGELRTPEDGLKRRVCPALIIDWCVPLRGCARRGRGGVRDAARGGLRKRSRHAMTLSPGHGPRTRDPAASPPLEPPTSMRYESRACRERGARGRNAPRAASPRRGRSPHRRAVAGLASGRRRLSRQVRRRGRSVGVVGGCMVGRPSDEVQMRKRGSGILCRNGPTGAAHKRYPTPFFTKPMTPQPCLYVRQAGCGQPLNSGSATFAGFGADGFLGMSRKLIRSLSKNRPTRPVGPLRFLRTYTSVTPGSAQSSL